MGAYIRGNRLTLVQRFYRIDPLTQATALADPTNVVFTVEDPNGDETSYSWGTDPEVTNPQVGIYLCALPAELPTGTYSYAVVGTGALEAADTGTFTILESGALAPDSPEVAQFGPCTPWINAQDVVDACGAELTEATAWKAETAASIASTSMWQLSAQLFSGICERTIRPCRDGCTCFGVDVLGIGPWYWGGFGGYGGFGSRWYNDCGDRCGCGPVGTTIELPDYPVREILEVKVDGDSVPLDQFDLRNRRDLVWLWDEDAGQSRLWPACQQLDRPDTDPGTFSIRYTSGSPPPEGGKAAAAALGCELYKSLNGQACSLPAKATRVVRQGITIEKAIPFAEMLRGGMTGILPIDLFIATVNPTGATRRPAVFSPDKPGFGVRPGSNS